jgi:glutathione S-transferase
MVQLTVYGDPKATCTQRVLILLEELGLKYDLKEVSLANGEHKATEHLQRQPFGKVPAIKYGEYTLFESRSILRYIADRNAEIVDLFATPDVEVWLEAESQNYNPWVSKIVAERVFKKLKNEKVDEEVVKNALEHLEKVLEVYDARLGNHKFIAGDDFSIADISHIPYTHHLIKAGFKDTFKKYPNVYSWLKRIMKREAVQRVLKNSQGSQ